MTTECDWISCEAPRATVHVDQLEDYCPKHARVIATKTLRDYVMERDRGICQRCGAGAHDAAHIIPKGRAPGIRYDPDNLLALCRPCHITVDGSPAYRNVWVVERWPGRLEALWSRELKMEQRRGRVDVGEVIRRYRHPELTAAERERYSEGAWL